MIKTKDRPEVPATLRSAKVKQFKRFLAEKVGRREKISSKDFSTHAYWSENDVKEALWDMHNGKCCYCERSRDMKRESDVEHFRPKSEVAEDGNHPGYWWLAYEWGNYLLSCKTCNQTYKKTNFPLLPGSQRAYTPNDIDNERPVLINPAEENPEDYIGFDWSTGTHVNVIGLDDNLRGYNTWKLLGLNEGTLPEQRAELLDELMSIAQIYFYAKIALNKQELLEEMKVKIELQTSSEREFAGFRRHFFKNLGLYKNPQEN